MGPATFLRELLIRQYQILLHGIFVLSHLLLCNAAYDPLHPPNTENFDPAEANPMGAIKCLGDAYDQHLPIQPDGWNPNSVSMQKLCAKPQYGGGDADHHMGAYCQLAPHFSDAFSQTGLVAFDMSP